MTTVGVKRLIQLNVQSMLRIVHNSLGIDHPSLIVIALGTVELNNQLINDNYVIIFNFNYIHTVIGKVYRSKPL